MGPARSTNMHHHYRHEAFLYDGHDEFMQGALGFIDDAIAADEPILVALGAAKIELLRRELSGTSEHVLFADMREIGTNPARIIPAWQDFLDEHAVRDCPVRGIGEPIWSGRSPTELVECQHHETLLNVAFADPSFWLLCPYDTTTLDAGVIEEARCTHPIVRHGGVSRPSGRYRGEDAVSAYHGTPLPEPPIGTPALAFGSGDLPKVRQFVGSRATGAGLRTDRADDLVLAAHEVATNSLRHGGGSGSLRVWEESNIVLCEIQDSGHIAEPMVGRRRPSMLGGGGRGMWLANQLCDLVQIRSSEAGNVVRLHVSAIG